MPVYTYTHAHRIPEGVVNRLFHVRARTARTYIRSSNVMKAACYSPLAFPSTEGFIVASKVNER